MSERLARDQATVRHSERGPSAPARQGQERKR